MWYYILWGDQYLNYIFSKLLKKKEFRKIIIKFSISLIALFDDYLITDVGLKYFEI